METQEFRRLLDDDDPEALRWTVSCHECGRELGRVELVADATRCDACDDAAAKDAAFAAWLDAAKAKAKAAYGVSAADWSRGYGTRSEYASLPDGRRMRLSDHEQGRGHVDLGRAEISWVWHR